MGKVKVGIAGLGRLGKLHANNLAFKIPDAELTAACSIVPAELEYAKEQLGVADVYADYREMLEKADIDAVAIVTTSGEHCWQIEAALDAGKHVFSDKPLGITVEECRTAEAAVERHPELTFFLGFMRRYDPSYAYAKEKIKEGAIGTPYMVKAAGIDPEALAEGAIKFAATSGGIFIDMAIQPRLGFWNPIPWKYMRQEPHSNIRSLRKQEMTRPVRQCINAKTVHLDLCMSDVLRHMDITLRQRLSALRVL